MGDELVRGVAAELAFLSDSFLEWRELLDALLGSVLEAREEDLARLDSVWRRHPEADDWVRFAMALVEVSYHREVLALYKLRRK